MFVDSEVNSLKYLLVTLAMSNLPSSAFLSLSPPRSDFPDPDMRQPESARVSLLPPQADCASVLPDIHYSVTYVTPVLKRDKLRSKICFCSPSDDFFVFLYEHN